MWIQDGLSNEFPVRTITDVTRHVIHLIRLSLFFFKRTSISLKLCGLNIRMLSEDLASDVYTLKSVITQSLNGTGPLEHITWYTFAAAKNTVHAYPPWYVISLLFPRWRSDSEGLTVWPVRIGCQSRITDHFSPCHKRGWRVQSDDVLGVP